MNNKIFHLMIREFCRVAQYALFSFGVVGGIICTLVLKEYLYTAGIAYLAVLVFPHIKNLITE